MSELARSYSPGTRTIMPHLVSSISAHGFGHMAITAPVLEELHARMPECEVTISTDIPESALRSRVRCAFEVAPNELDFGLRMNRDLSVNVEKTLSDYAALHRHWDAVVGRRAEWLSRVRCDLLLSSISCLDIAAAARAGIPAVAVSPLNWADLYRYYAPDTAQCRAACERMVEAYNQAEVFLAPQPCMPMPNFNNVEVIPPVAQLGRDRRSLIRDVFDLGDDTRLTLLALGGQEASMHVDHLPIIEGMNWLVDEKWGFRRDDILCANDTGLAFPDLLASSDLLVGKPGYGAFAEAARLGKPVVYMRRPDWPEELFLIEWLQRQVPCREARLGELQNLASQMLELFDEPPSKGCSDDGTGICCERMVNHLT